MGPSGYSQAIAGSQFPSRRSVVQGARGAVATSQPLAAQAGLRMLLAGGNAFDAAIAAAAVLNVVEPMMTGIGGDVFALCYTARDASVHGLNASGRAPLKADLDDYRRRFGNKMPKLGIHSVTVPGAVDGWAKLLERFGTKSLADVLEPAIEYAEEGFPVSELIARGWQGAREKLLAHPDTARTYLSDGQAPRSGEIFRQPNLGRTLRLLSEGGRDVFYRGEIADKIVECSRREGGLFSGDDFARHTSTWVAPISVDYRGYRVYECPPNGQGLVALLALNLLSGYDLASMTWGSPELVHLQMEAIKLGFADGDEHVADPDFGEAPLDYLLSPEYAMERRKLINLTSAGAPANLPPANDTTYLTTVDAEGNGCSFINSLFQGFGSGVVVGDTGICLQNRGALFTLDPQHRNRLVGGKRPYHTIIPSMVTRNGRLWLSYGVIGGFMQPQGHVQVLTNLIDFGMNLQEALDAPRFQIEAGRTVAIERSFGPTTLFQLRSLGHDLREVDPLVTLIGGAQAIMVNPETGGFAAASEPRRDGMAVAF